MSKLKTKGGVTILPDGSGFSTGTVQTKKAETVDAFATEYLKTAGLQDFLNPRVWQAAARRSFEGPHGNQLSPMNTAIGGSTIGAAAGTAGALAASPFIDSHSAAMIPAATAALGALPGAVHGAVRFPGQLSNLSRHLGAQR